MGAKTAKDVRGLEHDWLGADANGYVGLFSTAGGGYAPRALLRDTDRYDEAIDAILPSLRRQRHGSRHTFDPERRTTWLLAACRGLFAFDADLNGGPYKLVAAPVLPAVMTDLPPLVIDAASRIQFKTLLFDRVSIISSELIRLECEP